MALLGKGGGQVPIGVEALLGSGHTTLMPDSALSINRASASCACKTQRCFEVKSAFPEADQNRNPNSLNMQWKSQSTSSFKIKIGLYSGSKWIDYRNQKYKWVFWSTALEHPQVEPTIILRWAIILRDSNLSFFSRLHQRYQQSGQQAVRGKWRITRNLHRYRLCFPALAISNWQNQPSKELHSIDQKSGMDSLITEYTGLPLGREEAISRDKWGNCLLSLLCPAVTLVLWNTHIGYFEVGCRAVLSHGCH